MHTRALVGVGHWRIDGCSEATETNRAVCACQRTSSDGGFPERAESRECTVRGPHNEVEIETTVEVRSILYCTLYSMRTPYGAHNICMLMYAVFTSDISIQYTYEYHLKFKSYCHTGACGDRIYWHSKIVNIRRSTCRIAKLLNKVLE